MKYSSDCAQKLMEFTDEMTADSVEFWTRSSIHHIAGLLSVHRDTIYDWKNKHPEFSDAIKRWEERRNSLFLELRRKDGAWIFLAKNWLGMTDKQEVKQETTFKPLTVILGDNGNAPDTDN